MITEEKHIAGLLLRHFTSGLSEAEQSQLDEWLARDEAHRVLYSSLQADEGGILAILAQRKEDEEARLSDRMYEHITAAIALGEQTENIIPIRRPVSFLRRWWAAASILLLLAAGASFWFQQNKPDALTNTTSNVPTDIAPGKDGAILTLADGTEVVLDSLGNGLIALQSGAQVVLQNGQLTYDPTGESAGEAVYNTMSTPKGRQFSLLLPDGTSVWLNAASSLRYPTVFTGSERRVEIVGEAYFEVAKNTKMPFRVIVANKAEVEVLGTHFNLNAYGDESTINTTLLEGSVRVSSIRVASSNQLTTKVHPGMKGDWPATILKPGEQAQIAVAGSSERKPFSSQLIKVIHNADTDKVMAWRNGLINFDGLTFEEIMRQFERWYDIEVIYEGPVPDVQLRGEMTRGVTLNELLKNLGKLGLHCRLEDRTLVVLP